MTAEPLSVTPPRKPSGSGITDLFAVVNLMLRQRRVILTLAAVVGLATFGYVITRHRTYTSSASFLLQPPKLAGAAAASGIAAQLGLSLPPTDPGQSPAFYEEMIRSRGLLGALADTTFTFRTTSGAETTAALADAYRVRPREPARRRAATLEKLNQAIAVRTSPKSGVVTFSVVAPEAALAAQIADAILAQLSFFNLQRRQSQAAAERQFTEKRLAEVREDLLKAENALADFLRRNRSLGGSPQLKFEEERFAREVELRRTLYTSMSQSFEQAKIEEVRDTPQITVVERPDIPALPDSRMLIGKTLLLGVFGGLIGLLLGFLRERVGLAQRTAAEEVLEFSRLRRSVTGGFPWRRRTGQ